MIRESEAFRCVALTVDVLVFANFIKSNTFHSFGIAVLNSQLQNAMNLKNNSVIGFIVAVLALVTLLYRRSLIAEDPIGITIQVLSFLLMIWARITFGKRNSH